jgi:PadR family transcriptional regulator, regulatory protein PadR
MGRSEMRQPSFLVLASLAGGRQHGYGLMQSIQAAAGEGGGVQAGTLYAALDRLADEGLIRVAGEETVDGRPRRYYELTDEGASALAVETARLARRLRLAEDGLAARRRARRAAGGTETTGAMA